MLHNAASLVDAHTKTSFKKTNRGKNLKRQRNRNAGLCANILGHSSKPNRRKSRLDGSGDPSYKSRSRRKQRNTNPPQSAHRQPSSDDGVLGLHSGHAQNLSSHSHGRRRCELSSKLHRRQFHWRTALLSRSDSGRCMNTPRLFAAE